jgi:hypothetical protein
MRILFRLICSLPIAGMVLFADSCAPEACFDETNSYLKAFFYNDSLKKLLPPDSISLTGLNQPDNKIYDKATGVQPALLPLDASAGSCSFIIHINGIADTIDLSYTSYPHLISKECGYTFYHNLDECSCSYNAIVDIYINTKRITTVNEENIRIFY